MLEFIFYGFVIYGVFAIPYKLWVTSGKYEYLKKDTDAKIQTLEFNNNYYIEQINNYFNQIRSLSDQKDTYYSLWSEAYDKLVEVEDIVAEMPDGEYKTRLEDLIYRDDEVEDEEDV